MLLPLLLLLRRAHTLASRVESFQAATDSLAELCEEHVYVVPRPDADVVAEALAAASPSPSPRAASGRSELDESIPLRGPTATTTASSSSSSSRDTTPQVVEAGEDGSFDLDEVVEEASPDASALALAASTARRASELKDQGNAQLASRKYVAAIRLYDAALDLEPPP